MIHEYWNLKLRPEEVSTVSVIAIACIVLLLVKVIPVFEQMFAETGVTSHDVIDRMVDFGVQHCMPSHMPMLVPEPFTMEPGESLTVAEMDQMLAALQAITGKTANEPPTPEPDLDTTGGEQHTLKPVV